MTGGALTLSERLAFAKNRPVGFDCMRISLALAVILWHSRLGRVLEPLALLIVPMFFALGGFLVAGSLERSRSLVGFLGLRAFRIMPALAVEVLLSALIFGLLLTTLSLGEYFASLASTAFHSWYASVLISVPIAAAIATASWRFIENLVPRRRDKLKLIEDWHLRTFQTASGNSRVRHRMLALA